MRIHLKGEGIEIEYGWPDGLAPEIGDEIVADGSDEELPAGIYEVKDRRWLVSVSQRVLQLDIECLLLEAEALELADAAE